MRQPKSTGDQRHINSKITFCESQLFVLIRVYRLCSAASASSYPCNHINACKEAKIAPQIVQYLHISDVVCSRVIVLKVLSRQNRLIHSTEYTRPCWSTSTHISYPDVLRATLSGTTTWKISVPASASFGQSPTSYGVTSNSQNTAALFYPSRFCVALTVYWRPPKTMYSPNKRLCLTT